MASNQQEIKILQKKIELLEEIIKGLKSVDPEVIIPRIEKLEKRYFMVKEILDIDELSEYLGMARSTLYKYTGPGQIPCFKKGKSLFFERKQINKWLKNNFFQDKLEDTNVNDLNPALRTSFLLNEDGEDCGCNSNDKASSDNYDIEKKEEDVNK